MLYLGKETFYIEILLLSMIRVWCLIFFYCKMVIITVYIYHTIVSCQISTVTHGAFKEYIAYGKCLRNINGWH